MQPFVCQKRKYFFPFFLSIFLLFLCITPSVFANSATISLSPATGSFAKPFAVSVVVNGGGDAFNAAQATVTVSQTTTIKDLALGDCNFSFLKTPSVADPSFEGAMLGSSSKKCTVYTLALSPTAKGTATVSLTKASVRRFGDAAEILSSAINGNYLITGTAGNTSQDQTQETPIPTPANGLYTVQLKVLSSNAAPVSSVSVSLTTVAGKTQQAAATDTTGTALFTNLTPGIYTATVTKENTQLAKTILNVSGSNHVLRLSMNLQAQQTNPLLKNSHSLLKDLTTSPFLIAGVLALGVLVGVGIALLLIFLMRRKKAANGSL